MFHLEVCSFSDSFTWGLAFYREKDKYLCDFQTHFMSAHQQQTEFDWKKFCEVGVSLPPTPQIAAK